MKAEIIHGLTGLIPVVRLVGVLFYGISTAEITFLKNYDTSDLSGSLNHNFPHSPILNAKHTTDLT